MIWEHTYCLPADQASAQLKEVWSSHVLDLKAWQLLNSGDWVTGKCRRQALYSFPIGRRARTKQEFDTRHPAMTPIYNDSLYPIQRLVQRQKSFSIRLGIGVSAKDTVASQMLASLRFASQRDRQISIITDEQRCLANRTSWHNHTSVKPKDKPKTLKANAFPATDRGAPDTAAGLALPRCRYRQSIYLT